MWPMPHDCGGQQDGIGLWRPTPEAPGLVTPIFRGIVVSRLVTASVAHANHVLDNLGAHASEPGPHALLLLSAQPVYREPLPQRPSWYTPALPEVEEPAPTAHVRVASRLVGIGDGDDLLPLLAELTAIASANIATAAAARKLLHQHDQPSLAALAGRLTLDLPWTPPAPFPYAQALAQGELWDPRMPHTGIAPTSKKPLTPDVTYLGVAVTTLDSPTDRWVDVKDTWRGARDPELLLPVTAGSLPGTVWAVLEDGTAMHIDRTPESLREARTHTVVSNAPIERGYDRIISISHQPRLVQDSPPRLPLAGQPAQRTAELWQHLAGLHTALRTAFGYEVPA